jgi:hypothetical protein
LALVLAFDLAQQARTDPVQYLEELNKKDRDFDYYDALPTKEGRALSTVQGT